jgi:hypothetical protein
VKVKYDALNALELLQLQREGVANDKAANLIRLDITSEGFRQAQRNHLEAMAAKSDVFSSTFEDGKVTVVYRDGKREPEVFRTDGKGPTGISYESAVSKAMVLADKMESMWRWDEEGANTWGTHKTRGAWIEFYAELIFRGGGKSIDTDTDAGENDGDVNGDPFSVGTE